MSDKYVNYNRIATMWGAILGKAITPAQVALCLHQFHLNSLIDYPHCQDTTVKMAETIFAYEALSKNTEDRR